MIEEVCGGSTITPESEQEISPFRAEHDGTIAVLLIVYTLQIFMGNENTSGYTIYIWLDNV